MLSLFKRSLLTTPRSVTPSLATSFPRLYSTPAPPQLTDGESSLKSKLESLLDGAVVQVQDVSGHSTTSRRSRESIADESWGMSTIKQHRAVNELLKDDIKGMHGVQLKTSAP
ncbi:hypothetical protein P7C70_g1235, partial [Phenoliferia sp. Uapishka_3]